MAQTFQLESFAAGALLICQDHEICHVGMIVSGGAEIVIEGPAKTKIVVGRAGRGDFFGVTCFLERMASPFSIVCREPIECWIQEISAFFEMIEAYPAMREHFYILALCQMSDALKCINGSGIRLPINQEKMTPRQRKLEKAMRFIDRNFARSISLKTAAKKSGMSTFHFSRVFKAEIGRTFKEYVTYRRIEAAKVLLLCGVPISEAGKKNGFHNPSYFTRVFRRRQGMTPTEYLKMTE